MPAEYVSGPYANETYLRGLKSSAADIERQVRNTLTEISRQRQVGQEAAAKIAGAAASAYAPVQENLGADLSSLGVQPLTSLTEAFTDEAAAYKDVGTLMGKGFQEEEVARTGGVKNIRSELLSDLRAKAREYISRRQQEDRQRSFETEENRRARLLQRQMAEQQAALAREQLAMQARLAAEQRAFQAQQGSLDRATQMRIAEMQRAGAFPNGVNTIEQQLAYLAFLDGLKNQGHLSNLTTEQQTAKRRIASQRML